MNDIIVSDSGDTAWMLAASALALLTVLPGILLLHAGRGTASSALWAIGQSLAVIAAVSLLWAVVGYSIAFAPGTALLGGFSNLFLGNLADIREALTVPESAFVLFQMMLAMVAVALLAGAYGARARLGWAIGFSLVWSLIVYAPLAHWLWGGGWLANLGAIDFAGGIVVHASVGVSALVLARMFGASAVKPAPHANALAMAGVGLIWVGWFGVSGGWALSATDEAASAILNTHLAASAGALCWALVERLRKGAVSAMGFVMGALAGIAAISSAAGYVGPVGAIVIGVVGAGLAHFAARMGRKWLGMDDPLNIFAIHGVGGIAGSLLVAFFAFPALGGPGLEGSGTMISQIIAQGVAVIAACVWAVIGTLIAAYGVAMIFPLLANETADGERGWDLG